MADKILFKRSLQHLKDPTLADLMLGEVAINANDGKIFTRREYTVDGDPVQEIVSFVSKVPVGNVLYVSANGDDNNNEGNSWDRAFASIEKAIEEATARNGIPTLIDIGPGTYYTQGHIDVPDNCAIRSVHRTVFIRPIVGYEQRNVFRLGSGCFVEGLLIEGFEVDDFDDPTEGFAFSFRPGAVISRAPYAHKCAIRRIPTWDYIAPPLDRNNGNPLVGRGGGVVLADGNVCSPYSIYPNFMTWGATPVTQNGIGYCAKNGALINAVNAVSIWAHKHFYALNGGQIILSSCSTQFGDYTMVAKGTRNLVYPVEMENVTVIDPLAPSDTVVVYPEISTISPYIATELAADIAASRQSFIDNVWGALVLSGYTVGWTAQDETYTRRDTGTLIDDIVKTLENGDENYMLNFARGMFYADGTKVYDIAKEPAFIAAWTALVSYIQGLGSCGTSEADMIDALITALISTVQSPTTEVVVISIQDSDAYIINNMKSTIINDMWTALVADGYTTGWTLAQENYTKRDAGTLIDAIVRCLNNGDENYITSFIKSLFISGQPVFNSNKLEAFLFCFNNIRDQIFSFGVNSTTLNIVCGIVNSINYTIRYPSYIPVSLSVQTTASSAITNAKTTIINSMWDALVNGGYTDGWDSTDETFTKRDGGTFLQCIAWVLQSGNEKPMLDFAKGLFNTQGQKVYNIDKQSAFFFAFNFMREQISGLVDVNNASDLIIEGLVAALNTTLTNPTLRVEPSTITAIGHTWTGVLAGVVLTKIPPVRNEAKIQDSILEIDQGNVIASGQDDQGSAIFVGGLEINADTGELGGPPFDTAVKRIATKAAIARSY